MPYDSGRQENGISASAGCSWITVGGERMMLSAERAVFWPDAPGGRSTLLISDTHFGKAETFHEHGIPVPDGGTDYDLVRLKRLVTQFDVDRLIILGDLFHSSRNSSWERVSDFFRGFERPGMTYGNSLEHVGAPHEKDIERPGRMPGIGLEHQGGTNGKCLEHQDEPPGKGIELILVMGNHDIMLQSEYESIGFQCHRSLSFGPFLLQHQYHPKAGDGPKQTYRTSRHAPHGVRCETNSHEYGPHQNYSSSGNSPDRKSVV